MPNSDSPKGFSLVAGDCDWTAQSNDDVKHINIIKITIKITSIRFTVNLNLNSLFIFLLAFVMTTKSQFH